MRRVVGDNLAGRGSRQCRGLLRSAAAAFHLALVVRISWGAALAVPPSDYIIDVWQVDEGLPQISVTSIAQTTDGYLWLGTFNGLARFDGVRFTLFDEGNTPALGSSRITQVMADPQDGLWVVTEPGGLARLAKGQCFGYGPVEGLPATGVRQLVRDPKNALRLIDRAGRLHRIENGRILPEKGENILGSTNEPTLLFAGNGPCWIGRQGQATLGTLAPLSVSPAGDDHAALTNLYVLCATPSRAGGYWLVVTSGVCRVEAGRLQTEIVRFPEPLADLQAVIENDEGGLLLGSWDGGLIRWNLLERWQRFKVNTDSADVGLTSLFRDREGNLWIGTSNRGLHRLKPRVFHVYDTRDGLSADTVTSVCADRAGRVWIGINGGGLNCWQAGRIERLQEPARLRRHPLVYSVLADREDGVWIGLYSRGALRLHAGELTAYTVEEGFLQATSWALLEDRKGAVWLGSDHGLRQFQDGRFTLYTRQDGLGHDSVRALAEDRSGTLYIGTSGGGLSLLRAGQFTRYNEDEGLADNHIASLWLDREDTLWIGTANGGLSRFKQGRFTNATVRDGLPSNSLGTLIEDDAGNLWLGSNRGIFRLNRQQLNEYLEGRRRNLPCHVFNHSDGLNTIACTGGGQPASCKTPDGRLWFSTAKGVAVVDPNHLPLNSLPPPVAIEEVALDDVVYELQRRTSETPNPEPTEPVVSSGTNVAAGKSRGAQYFRSSPLASLSLTVPPGIQRVEFRFTGLSLVASEKVRFRYRLDGLDDNWVEAGLQRVAHYTRIPPGQYRFRVTACNNDGVWNKAGAKLAVVVLPAWWQTWWFRIAAFVGATGLVGWTIGTRMQRLKRERAVQQAFSRRLLESQEAERKRIATELHDSLGQDLLVIKNRALLGLQNPTVTVPALEQFDEISRVASHTLEEVRDISHNLRPYQLDRLGLTKALQAMVGQVSRASGIPITIGLDSLDKVLLPPQEIHFYRIVQELLNNLVKHSHASTARVAVRLSASRIMLAVEDDGCGFDTARLSMASEQQGLGLTGMTERVRLLGGTVRCDSRPAGGTRWSIEIPATSSKPANGTA